MPAGPQRKSEWRIFRFPRYFLPADSKKTIRIRMYLWSDGWSYFKWSLSRSCGSQQGYSVAGPISEEYIVSPMDIINEEDHITKVIIPIQP